MKKNNRKLAAIAVIMDSNEKVLLTKRHQPDSKHTHDKWMFPGGGIEHGEHPIDTVQREIQEELGDITYRLLSQDPLLRSNYFKDADIHAILLGFPVQYIGGEIDISDDPESSDAAWFSLDELETLDCMPGTYELVKRALTYIS